MMLEDSHFLISRLRESRLVGSAMRTDLYTQWNITEGAKINPYLNNPFIFDKDARTFKGKSIILSTNCAGTTGYPYAKE